MLQRVQSEPLFWAIKPTITIYAAYRPQVDAFGLTKQCILLLQFVPSDYRNAHLLHVAITNVALL